GRRWSLRSGRFRLRGGRGARRRSSGELRHRVGGRAEPDRGRELGERALDRIDLLRARVVLLLVDRWLELVAAQRRAAGVLRGPERAVRVEPAVDRLRLPVDHRRVRLRLDGLALALRGGGVSALARDVDARGGGFGGRGVALA